MPTKSHATDAGFDLYAKESFYLAAGRSHTFDTGVHIQLPKGTAGVLVSKSGLNVLHGITSTGLIDEGYTGSIAVKLYNNSNTDYLVEKGDKISQLMIVPYVTDVLCEADRLDESERGNKGFGSSGR